MKAGWKVRPLGKVCELIKRGIAPKYVETGGIVVINQKCIRNHEIDFALARRNDLEKKTVPDERLIKLGDVLVNSTGTGTLGRVAQVRMQEKFDATVDTHVTIVRPIAGKFYLPFFGYMMRMIEDEIKDAGQGVGGQTELSRDALTNSFSVSYPDDLEEQKRIVAVLDAAFEGLTRAKENAEANLQNARELFEAQRRSTLELAGATAPTVSLDDVCTVQRGSSPRPIKNFQTTDATGVNWIKIGDTKQGAKFVTSTKERITPEGAEKSRRVEVGDFILTNSMTFGRPYIMAIDGYIHDGWFVLRLNDGIEPNFFYHLLSSTVVQDQFQSLAAGSVVKNISGDLVKKATFGIPCETLQREYAAQLDNLSSEVEQLQSNYTTKLADIADLRQSILQKAFAGELT